MVTTAAGPLLGRLTEIPAPARLGLVGPLRLRRAWPREGGHLLLEYRDTRGRRVAGQHLADPEHLRRVARATGSGHPERVATVEHLGVLLQAHGADRRLGVLAGLLDDPGAELVVHRPERRAVVHLNDSWVKVVRSGRVDRLVVATAALAASEDVAAPQPLEIDPGAGLTRWSTVPGTPLIDLLSTVQTPADAFAAVGAALRRVHGRPAPPALPVHGPEGEQRTLHTWVTRMAVLDPGWADVLRSRLPAVEAGLSAGTGRIVLTHGDLHDRQILVAPSGVGVIDADTAAGGEAAQDVANLLVHLELRAAQGRCLAARAGALAAAILDGYGPGPDVVARLPAYAAATRLRLAAVYRLRPRDPRVCMGLLDRLHDPVPGL